MDVLKPLIETSSKNLQSYTSANVLILAIETSAYCCGRLVGG